MSGLHPPAPERSFASAATVSSPPRPSPARGEGGDGTPLPGPSYNRLKQAFDRLLRTRHAALSHVRTHTVGQRCPRCDKVITDDRLAQAAYEAAWRELFDDAPPRAAGIGANIDPPDLGGASPAPTGHP